MKKTQPTVRRVRRTVHLSDQAFEWIQQAAQMRAAAGDDEPLESIVIDAMRYALQRPPGRAELDYMQHERGPAVQRWRSMPHEEGMHDRRHGRPWELPISVRLPVALCETYAAWMASVPGGASQRSNGIAIALWLWRRDHHDHNGAELQSDVVGRIGAGAAATTGSAKLADVIKLVVRLAEILELGSTEEQHKALGVLERDLLDMGRRC
jgi:hypothetical protein